MNIPGYKIVIVNNNKEEGKKVSEELIKTGFNASEEVYDYNTPVLLIERSGPHLIILDAEYNGTISVKELSIKIKELKDIPILYLTKNGIELEDYISESDIMIYKPVKTNELVQFIQLVYYKQKYFREAKKGENKETKLNKKLVKEIKYKSFYEKQILRSKHLYYSSFNALNECVFVVDNDLNIVLENKALRDFKEKLNINEPTLGSSVDIFSKHLEGFHMTDYIMILKTGEVFYNEEIQLKDDVIVEIWKKPIVDDNGEISKVITIIKDITENKKNERKIHEQRAKLSSNLNQQKLLSEISIILNTVDDFEVKINRVLQIIGKNFELNRIYIFEGERGITISNTYEWTCSETKALINIRKSLSSEDLKSVRRMLNSKKIITTSDFNNFNEKCIYILKGDDVKALVILPLYSTNEITGFIGFDECIAERKWTRHEMELLRTVSGIISNAFQRKYATDSLVESEQKTRAIVNAIPDTLLHLNREGTIINYRSNKKESFALISKNILNNKIEKIFPVQFAELMMKNLESGLKYGESTTEFQLETNKKQNDYEARIEKINENEVVILIRNVTDRKLYEHILKEAKENAERANKSKDKLFSIISHDLKGPLADLKTLLEVVLFDIDRYSKENIIKCFQDIKENTDATYNLLQNLLQWSRKELNSVIFEKVKFNLNEVILNTITLFRQCASRKNIKLIYKESNNLDAFADKNMVDTIIRNLVNNAIKYSYKNGEIIISAKRSNGLYEISVKDKGVGIKKENQKKLLSKNEFYTTRGTNNEKGTGVGLDLCRDFVEMNRGKFWFESEEGKGSTFYFTVPAG